MPGLPVAAKRLRLFGVASLLLALTNRRRYRWFTSLGLAAFGAAWFWQRRQRVQPPMGLLQDDTLPAGLAVVEVGAYDPVWLVRLGRAVAPRPLHGVSGLVPIGPQHWLRRMEAAARQACLLERVTPVVADAGHLPLPDSQAALVVLHDVFARQPDRESRQRAVEEAVRILAPGGKLLIGEQAWSSEAAATMAGKGLGVRKAADGHTHWVVGTKTWS